MGSSSVRKNVHSKTRNKQERAGRRWNKLEPTKTSWNQLERAGKRWVYERLALERVGETYNNTIT